MKRAILITVIMEALLLSVMIPAALSGGYLLLIPLGAAAILGGCQIYLLLRQEKIMDFLVQQTREQTAVPWSEEEEKKLDIVKKRVELYTLQSQINPHFLYNTLDSIRSRAMLDGNREIAEMTEVLSRFFRYCIIYDERLVRIREELDHIRDYFYIQKYRFEDRFETQIELENDGILDYYIPKMTLQPLVENAMVHGLERVRRRGLLSIRIVETRGAVILTVSDNGVGMDAQQLEKMNQRMRQMRYEGSRKGGGHSGIAAANVNAQIMILFGEEYGIRYRSLPDVGTDAEVMIPRVDDFGRIRYEESW